MALDKSMQVLEESHSDICSYPTNVDVVSAIVEEVNRIYEPSIATLLPLKRHNQLAMMLHLNENTDPGFKVRAVYNNIFIWNPSTQVDFSQEVCDPEREYATIQSWLDKQHTQHGILPYFKPSDSVLLCQQDQSVLKRLKEKILQEQAAASPSHSDKALKVYFIGPMDTVVLPKSSAYLQKCIPRIIDQVDSLCDLLICVIAMDHSIKGIQDVCAPLPGYDMNILTVFDPSEFCPTCFVLKIAKRQV